MNVIPDYVKMESYTRAANVEALARYNRDINRALNAGAMALNAKCDITDLPGYLPLKPDENFRTLLRENANQIFGAANVEEGRSFCRQHGYGRRIPSHALRASVGGLRYRHASRCRLRRFG